MDEHPNRRRAAVGRCSHEESKRGLPERVNRNPPTVRKKMKRNKREKKGPKHWLSLRLGRRWWWLCSWPQVVLGVGSELSSWPRQPWRGTRAREKRGRERERERERVRAVDDLSKGTSLGASRGKEEMTREAQWSGVLQSYLLREISSRDLSGEDTKENNR